MLSASEPVGTERYINFNIIIIIIINVYRATETSAF